MYLLWDVSAAEGDTLLGVWPYEEQALAAVKGKVARRHLSVEAVELGQRIDSWHGA